MDRDKDAPAARSNGRPTAQLLVKQEGRKPLFGSNTRDDAAAKEQGKTRPGTGRFRSSGPLARRTNSESHPPPPPTAERRGSNSSVASSGSTRIPRPSSSGLSARKPISLAEAYKLAEQEEDDEPPHPADASPSPAPRAWRARNEQDERRMRKTLAEDHLDTKGRGKAVKGKPEVVRAGSDAQKPKALEVKKSESPRVPKAAVSVVNGRNLSTSNGGTPAAKDGPIRSRPLSGLFSRRSPSKETASDMEGGLPPLVPGIEDLPLASVEEPPPGGTPASTTLQPPFSYNNNSSPEKSYAWQVDQDFTAGDLQVSDSPRIRVRSQPFANRLTFDESSNVDINSNTRVNPPGSRNTKLDEIRTREARQGLDPVERPKRYPRLEEIRAREAEAEQIPIPDRNLPRPKNTKLDEIRQREVDGLSKRAEAAARLEEIREQNSMSRSLSPEDVRPQKSVEPGPTFVPEAEPPVRPKSAFEVGGERIPDTPVTVYKNQRERFGLDKGGVEEKGQDIVELVGNNRADSKDLLRRLARAASNSPSIDSESHKLPTPPKETEKPARSRSSIRNNNDKEKKSALDIKEPERTRPTVGFVEFAGLRRVRSSESTRSKRSSLHSEADPTDRIEAEMKLFAPQDNYSERGSVRAPSPAPDEKEEDEVEATPRPRRQDPLTMPTPRVVGAYVETPATVKAVDKWEDPNLGKAEKRHSAPEPLAVMRSKERAAAARRRSRDDDTASDPGVEEMQPARSSSAAVRKPRARSLPRRRPPLRNSAKPPSVKDDILELRRAHNIEDSTIDDFEDILEGRKAASPKLEALLKKTLDTPSDEEFEAKMESAKQGRDRKGSGTMDQDDSGAELAAVYDRMSKTLQTGLLGIRTAKQGIERLEGQVSHVEKQPIKTVTEKALHASEKQPVQSITENALQKLSTDVSSAKRSTDTDSSWMYIALPVPRLFRPGPRHHLTLFGLLTILLSLWLAAESSMCAAYCRPQTCSSPSCTWSYNDPVFGQAVPVKLDQWTTGGVGRKLFNAVLEDVTDWAADVEDMALGQDITDRDPETMTFSQRRQHRRRLYKKGLLETPGQQPLSPQQKARWDAWRETRLARERVREARFAHREDDFEEETVGGDKRVG